MKAGDKVVCVDNSACRYCGHAIPVLRDTVYVVNEVWPSPVSGLPCISLVGGHMPACAADHQFVSGLRVGYASERFRKLDELQAEARERQLVERVHYNHAQLHAIMHEIMEDWR